MRKIKKGEYMHSYTSGPCNDETRWVFPEDFEGLDDNAYYEIEYDYYSAADPCDFSCTYKVTYIKKVDDSLYHIIMMQAYLIHLWNGLINIIH